MPHGKLTPGYRSKTEGEVQNLAGVPQEFMKLFEHDPSEVIVTQALRHWIGSVMIILTVVFAIILTLGLVAFIGSEASPLKTLGLDTAQNRIISTVIGFAMILLILIFGFLAERVYVKSRMILTNQKIVLIKYHSIIAREVSQLNIGEVEDVNVYQSSIFDRLFNMGIITVETSGEQNNYNFRYVKDPYPFAHKTIQMHEGSIAEYGN